MTKQEKLQVIYEKIARKDLSFGCIIEYPKGNHCYVKGMNDSHMCVESISIINKTLTSESILFIEDVNIIGHPVMIGDCIKWVFDNVTHSIYSYYDETRFKEGYLEMMLRTWDTDKIHLPIDNQSDECIDYIYSLITK